MHDQKQDPHRYDLTTAFHVHGFRVTGDAACVHPAKWARHRYSLISALGPNGTRLTGSDAHVALSRKAAQEGMVLLENNGLLPLKKGTTVALFGVGSLDYMKSGGGSGTVFSQYTSNIYEGFAEKEPHIHVYEPLTRFYYDYAQTELSSKAAERGVMEEATIPGELLADAARSADVAIITIYRYSREGADRVAEKGDFYLTDQEQLMVGQVTGAFEHSVVVLNVGGMTDVSWIKKNKKIDAALLAWQAGMEGGAAVADILCGDVNPSGKLTDTFARTFQDYPSANTFHESDDYVCYYEDIYVGYRYFETVPGAKDKVVYPFGYGLSYTTFDICQPVAELSGEQIKVSVHVKNTGAVSGKEVVQVYYSAPQGKLGKSAIELAAFKKTRLLAPGEQQELVLTFSVTDMASYDDLGKCQKSAYILEKGDYRFFAGSHCRNLKEAAWHYSIAENYIVTRQLSQQLAPNKLSKRMLADGSYEKLPSFPVKVYDTPAPVNSTKLPEGEAPYTLEQAAQGEISLDAFMTQLTEEELTRLVGGVGNRGVANTLGMGDNERLGIPPVMTADGPAGIRLDPCTGIAVTAWPCATLLACTWDPDIIYEIGVAGGMEAKENALAIWLTPALNIHRNPLCGRNFEYFSEDPLIAGKFAAAKVRGMQSVGVAASAKHFACNNKETNRLYCDSRLSERALREIYLRGFEICVKEAQLWTIMTAYNYINGVRCCESYELIEQILRREWGYKGMVTTDWHVPCDQTACIRAGNDIRMPWGFPERLQEALKDGTIQRGHLERCVKHILEMILKLY